MSGVTITFHSQVANSCQRRMKPSGQQYCDGHCGVVVDAFVIRLLHHPLLILGLQQRQDRRHLVVTHLVPIVVREARMRVAAVVYRLKRST